MTEEEIEKDNKTKEENKKKVLFALAVGLGLIKDEDLIDENLSYENLDDTQIKESIKKYETTPGLKEKVEVDEPIDEKDIQRDVVEALKSDVKWFKIKNVGDSRTCKDCKKWIGKIVSVEKNDIGFPTVDDFINSHGLHPNCRCSLQELDTKEIPRKRKSLNSKPTSKELKELAMNSDVLKDTIVYRGFIDENLDENITYDFGETLVMITPIGEYYGSTSEGKPTKEIVDEKSLELMATQTEEILLDRDHGAFRNGADKDSAAMGWISGLKAITGLGDMSGLYGIVKWTEEGMRLVKDRTYRFLSPVFGLDENDHVIKLEAVGLTNRPALKMPPILNNESTQDSEISITQTQKDTDNMNKDEIKDMIKTMITEALNSCKEVKEEEVINEAPTAPQPDDKPVTDSPAETVIIKETKTEEKETKVQDFKKDEEVKNEEPKTDEVKDEIEDKEVIKKESLNSAPMIGKDVSYEWKNLHGEEFFEYLRKHPEVR